MKGVIPVYDEGDSHHHYDRPFAERDFSFILQIFTAGIPSGEMNQTVHYQSV
jgi:hypothetical protein